MGGGQYARRVICAEAFSLPDYAGKDFLRENLGVGDSRYFRKADVARSTILLIRDLAEIVKDSPMPAGSAGAIAIHIPQLCRARFKNLRFGIPQDPLPG